jgi:hypothetical protein
MGWAESLESITCIQPCIRSIVDAAERGVLDDIRSTLEQCRSALEAIVQTWAHFVKKFRESCWETCRLCLIGAIVQEIAAESVVKFSDSREDVQKVVMLVRLIADCRHVIEACCASR